MAIDKGKVNVISSGKMFDAATWSADTASKVLYLPPDVTQVSFHLILDANDCNGTLRLQESNSPDATDTDAYNDADWIDVTFDDGSSSISVAGSDLNEIYHVETFARYMRWSFDNSSGSATSATIVANVKQSRRG